MDTRRASRVGTAATAYGAGNVGAGSPVEHCGGVVAGRHCGGGVCGRHCGGWSGHTGWRRLVDTLRRQSASEIAAYGGGCKAVGSRHTLRWRRLEDTLRRQRLRQAPRRLGQRRTLRWRRLENTLRRLRLRAPGRLGRWRALRRRRLERTLRRHRRTLHQLRERGVNLHDSGAGVHVEARRTDVLRRRPAAPA